MIANGPTGVHAVIGDTRTPVDELDPGWHGAVTIRRSPRELAWPATVLALPAVAAGTAFLATGDPTGMVGAGFVGFAVMVVLDLRRPRQRG